MPFFKKEKNGYHEKKGHNASLGDFTYKGNWKHDEFDGKGTLTRSNGGTYTGQFRNGKRHGEGKLTRDGNVFEGTWARDFFKKGKKTCATGDVWEGEFDSLSLISKGTVTEKSGTVWEGEFEKKSRGGFYRAVSLVKGTKTLTSGKVYEGEFKQLKAKAKGKESRTIFVKGKKTTTDGDVWDGEFHEDGRFMKGTKTCGGEFEGTVFEGEWSDRMFTTGKKTLKNGNVYEGTWKNKKLEGHGKYTSTSGACDEGTFKDGKLHGQGKRIFKGGAVYEGEFANSQMHGTGKITFANGEMFKGKWEKNYLYIGETNAEGQPHGQGRKFNTVYAYVGEFKNGKKDGKLTYSVYGNVRFQGEYKDDKKVSGVLTEKSGEMFKVTYEDGEVVSKVVHHPEPAPESDAAAKGEPAPASEEDRSNDPDIFISLRFGESLTESEALKDALVDRGLNVFLCDEQPGDDLMDVIVENLSRCRLAVIMATETYGAEGTTTFSTKAELKYITNWKKPYFLVKMCGAYKEELAKFLLGGSTQYHKWIAENDEQKTNAPEELVDAIIKKLESL